MLKNVCVYGDSFVYGLRDSQEGGWVTRLQKQLNSKEFQFWNFGIPGNTSFDLLKRIKEDIETKKPDIAIIFIGANDSQYEDNPKTTLISLVNFEKNLKLLCQSIRKHTSEILFIGLPKINDTLTTNWNYKYYFCNKNLMKYDTKIKNFCKKNNLNYVSLANLLNNDDLSDGIHPNEKGYQKIANALKTFFDLTQKT